MQAISRVWPAALDSMVMRALDPDPGQRFDSGNAMAAALEPIVAHPDPVSPTESFDSAVIAATVAQRLRPASAHSAAAARRPAPPPPPAAPPLQPGSGPGIAALTPVAVSGRAAGGARGARRASPAIAGPLVVLLLVATVVVGGLFIAALPGPAGTGGLAAANATPRATRSPSPQPTARPTPVPTPDPTP